MHDVVPQHIRCEDVGWWRRIALASQDVENDIGGMDAVGERLGEAASTAGKPSVSTALRISTICRLP